MNLRDERGVVINWLLKIGLLMVVLGVVIFDAGSIAVNFFGLDSAADDIAVALATDIRSGSLPETPNSPQLLAEAERLAKEQNARLTRVSYDPEQEIVRVNVKRSASTLVAGRIGPLEDWTRATAEGQSGTT